MKKYVCYLCFTLTILLISFHSGLSQETTCPAIVQTALDRVDSACGETGRNQACYGNVTLTAEPQTGVESLQFDSPGDIANVADIQSLALSPMDETSGEWGISLMKIQANLPDTLPGQNVTFLLLGDVEVRAAQTPPTLDAYVSAGGTVNVRSEPTTTGGVVGQLAPQTAVIANGRNDTGDWLRVFLPGGGVGWVASQLMQAKEAVSQLDVVGSDDAAYRPMQAFFFRSGVSDAPCAEAPDSGILIQTPKGAGTVELSVNGVSIDLHSTAFFEAVAGEFLYISLIEGEAQITAFGETQTAFPGTVVTVPIDDNWQAVGPPDTPQPYVDNVVQALPVDLLQEDIVVSSPASEEAIAEVEAQRTTCVLSAATPVILRTGPGTRYPDAGKLETGTSITGVGQAEGTDEMVWWQVDGENWVRSDVVEASDSCAELPTIDEIPPLPTPVVISGSESLNFNLCQFDYGNVWPEPVEAYSMIGASTGDQPSATAQMIVDGAMTVNFTVDGASHAPFHIEHRPQGPDAAEVTWWYRFGPLAPGIHQLNFNQVVQTTIPDWAFKWELSPGWSDTWTCTITVE